VDDLVTVSGNEPIAEMTLFNMLGQEVLRQNGSDAVQALTTWTLQRKIHLENRNQKRRAVKRYSQKLSSLFN
jgi:hypothetical protein